MNFESSATTGRLAVQSASAMVPGFGYAFLAAALLTVIGIIFTALLIHERQHSPPEWVSTLEEIIITIIVTAVMVPIERIGTTCKSSYFLLAMDLRNATVSSVIT